MPSDEEIQEDVLARHGVAIRLCWIANVKELNGLGHRVTRNLEPPTWRAYPCPDPVRPLIEESMKRLGLLPV